MRSLIAAACFTLSAIALPAAAQTPTPRQTMADFGLIGIWAANCAMPASAETGNSRSIYALSSGGRVMLTFDNGPGKMATTYAIVHAMRSGTDRLSFTAQRLPGDRRVNVTVEKKDNVLTLLSSVTEDGTILIQDGRRTSTGRPSIGQFRCL